MLPAISEEYMNLMLILGQLAEGFETVLTLEPPDDDAEAEERERFLRTFLLLQSGRITGVLCDFMCALGNSFGPLNSESDDQDEFLLHLEESEQAIARNTRGHLVEEPECPNRDIEEDLITIAEAQAEIISDLQVFFTNNTTNFAKLSLKTGVMREVMNRIAEDGH